MSSFRQRPAHTASSPISAAIEAAAADWLVRRDRGFDSVEAAQFATWLAADTRHAGALAELDQAWQTINQPRLGGRQSAVLAKLEVLEQRGARRREMRRVRLSGALLAAAAAIALLFNGIQPGAQFTPRDTSVRTALLKPDRQLLPDGSTVELNAGAEISVEFSPDRRAVRLVRGEALFSVVKDASRPFVVNAGGVDVRAIGTTFAVRCAPNAINVLVTEGQVAVERASDGQSLLDPPPSAPVADPILSSEPTLAAGQRLVVPVLGNAPPVVPVEVVSVDEIANALAWRHRRIEFSSTPLAEAVPLFNRGPKPHLTLANLVTAELRISGIFWTDDTEGFARLLQSSLGVRVVHQSDGTISLQK